MPLNHGWQEADSEWNYDYDPRDSETLPFPFPELHYNLLVEHLTWNKCKMTIDLSFGQFFVRTSSLSSDSNRQYIDLLKPLYVYNTYYTCTFIRWIQGV